MKALPIILISIILLSTVAAEITNDEVKDIFKIQLYKFFHRKPNLGSNQLTDLFIYNLNHRGDVANLNWKGNRSGLTLKQILQNTANPCRDGYSCTNNPSSTAINIIGYCKDNSGDYGEYCTSGISIQSCSQTCGEPNYNSKTQYIERYGGSCNAGYCHKVINKESNSCPSGWTCGKINCDEENELKIKNLPMTQMCNQNGGSVCMKCIEKEENFNCSVEFGEAWECGKQKCDNEIEVYNLKRPCNREGERICTHCQETISPNECKDSDGGKNPYINGNVTFGDRVNQDSCSAGSGIQEQYCLNGNPVTAWVDCPNGCEDGACIESSSANNTNDCSNYGDSYWCSNYDEWKDECQGRGTYLENSHCSDSRIKSGQCVTCQSPQIDFKIEPSVKQEHDYILINWELDEPSEVIFSIGLTGISNINYQDYQYSFTAYKKAEFGENYKYQLQPNTAYYYQIKEGDKIFESSFSTGEFYETCPNNEPVNGNVPCSCDEESFINSEKESSLFCCNDKLCDSGCNSNGSCKSVECSDCGAGLFNICDYNECVSFGDICEFEKNIIGGSCTEKSFNCSESDSGLDIFNSSYISGNMRVNSAGFYDEDGQDILAMDGGEGELCYPMSPNTGTYDIMELYCGENGFIKRERLTCPEGFVCEADACVGISTEDKSCKHISNNSFEVSEVGSSTNLTVGWYLGAKAAGEGLIFDNFNYDIAVEEIFGPNSASDCTNKINSVWHYNFTTKNWKAYFPETPGASDLEYISSGEVYSINVKENCMLSFEDLPINNGREIVLLNSNYCPSGCENGVCIDDSMEEIKNIAKCHEIGKTWDDGVCLNQDIDELSKKPNHKKDPIEKCPLNILSHYDTASYDLGLGVTTNAKNCNDLQKIQGYYDQDCMNRYAINADNFELTACCSDRLNLFICYKAKTPNNFGFYFFNEQILESQEAEAFYWADDFDHFEVRHKIGGSWSNWYRINDSCGINSKCSFGIYELGTHEVMMRACGGLYLGEVCTKPIENSFEVVNQIKEQPLKIEIESNYKEKINIVYKAPEHDGNFGGRKGIDSFCSQNMPNDLECSNIHGFVTAGYSDSIAAMPKNYGYSSEISLNWYNEKSKEFIKFSESWGDILDGSILVDAFTGIGIIGPYFWTGSTSLGTMEYSDTITRTCKNWNTNSNQAYTYGMVGNSGMKDLIIKDQNTGEGKSWLRNYDKLTTCNQKYDTLCICEAEVNLKPVKPLTIYGTKESHDGDFGGREGLDNFCIGEKPSELECENIHAFISVNENDRLKDMSLRYGFSQYKDLFWYNREDKIFLKFSNNWQDTFDGNIMFSAQQSGALDSTEFYWTGSYSDGRYYDYMKDYLYSYSCEGWTYSEMKTYNDNVYGKLGNPAESNPIWINDEDDLCSNYHKLLCICE